MTIPGYATDDELSRSERHVVHRGRRLADGKPVLLKLRLPGPGASARGERLEEEEEILRSVSGPGFPRVCELLRGDGSACLVLEDDGGVPLEAMIAAGRPGIEATLRIAVQLAALLGELHRRDLVHTSLHPRSILVHPVSGGVILADLSRAARGSLETQGWMARRLVPSALVYTSPEQTGRMNRATDYRTDFYSLGVILYELLTGAPPFRSEDSLELIHWHIARAPVPPSEVDPEVPAPLSGIVMKLLAKTAEERYQSARGLMEDLERCARERADHGRIADFPLGSRDVPDRFLIPQKLYGRDREVRELLGAFDRVCREEAAPASLMLVAGYSGIGKTSLIQEILKPIVRERGYFIWGKFDQVGRTVPFGGLIQAFRELVLQLLTESEERLSLWRAGLTEALGTSGGVLVEVIPEIALIIGEQPPPPALGPTEALNRFQLLFQNFVGALARREHPLVVFLDDLQWADPATLSLLQPLLTSPSARFLFLMGAYRDNEVDADHPLMRTLGALGSAGVELRRVTLGPLGLEDLTLFIRDAIRGDLRDAEPLARLVLEKTGGNPFFVIQFLKMLEREGFLKLDAARGSWSYRIEDIAGARMTDNVIDLMTRRLERLSPMTRHALTLAACIGNPFDDLTLATISEQAPDAAARNLEEALAEGLILRTGHGRRPAEGEAAESVGGDYSFLHDRVQQAAYDLIPAERRRSVHLAVGRLLLGGPDAPPAEDRIFDIIHHLNLGSALITDDAERLALARLNLAAGRKAKSSTAYDAALAYFEAGSRLIREGDWASEHDLGFALQLEAAECQNLCGNFDQADLEIGALLGRARTSLEKARAHGLRMVEYEALSRYADALASAREALSLFGIVLPESTAARQAALDGELASIRSLLGGRSIESLVDLPAASDPEVRMVMSILTTIWSSAYISGEQLLTRLISATMVRLSLVHGNCEESAYGYATHTITVGPLCEDYQAAYEFGCLALRVNERFGDLKRRAKIYQQFHAHANLWRRPLETCIAYAREASRSGFETGDFTYGIYGAYTETWVAILVTRDLARFVRDYSPYLALFKKLKVASVGDGQKVLLNWGRALQGETRSPVSLSDESFDEDAYARTYAGNPFFTVCLAVAKLHLSYLFGKHREALEIARSAGRIIHHLAGTIWPVVFDFWRSLTLAATWADAGEEERRESIEEMLRVEASLGKLAESCAESYLCYSLLVSAELARVTGRELDALDLYERALRQATETRMPQHQALASELCARSWEGRGNDAAVREHLLEAHRRYMEWGAFAKARDLEERHPGLMPAEDGPGGPGTGSGEGAEPGSLDIATVAKVARAIAMEVEIEGLLRKLMKLTLESAGAERGFFIREKDGVLVIEAEASVDPDRVTVLGAAAVEESARLSRAVVQYVRKTRETVVVGDAVSDGRFSGDPYVASARPRSILCAPIVHQGKLGGILYLENGLAANAFTAERVKVLHILASQAAISLENARLYGAMKEEVERRRKAEEDLRSALAEVEILKDRLAAENVYLQEEIRREHNFEEMVGSSPALLDVLGKVERIAPTDATVLIRGETGTGKELIARALHDRSARKDRPLVKVNCGAISAGLVESELFGHVKGAFTGALEDRVGRFELADGGTLFLDEVGELPLETQVKLLRVLQEQELEPVGSSRTVRVDVRIIAATNRDIEEAVRAGRFRSDLFYRLNVLPLVLPPLRERRSDVPQLVMFFLSRFSKRFGKKIDAVSQETMRLLEGYAWPGNVRELQNIIERAVVLSQGPVLAIEPDLLGAAPSAAARADPGAGGERAPDPTGAAAALPTLEEIERRHILAALAEAGGVIEGARGAARILDLHPNTLRSRMKKLGIRRAGHEIS